MGKCTEFLHLKEQERIEAGVLDPARCIDVEKEISGLLSRGDYVMGLGQTLKIWDSPYLN